MDTAARSLLRRIAAGAAVTLALAGCAGPSDGDAAASGSSPGVEEPAATDRESPDPTAAATGGADAVAAEPRTALSLCDTLPSVLDEDTILGWLNLQDGEHVEGATCEAGDPESNRGQLSDYWFTIAHPDNPALGANSTAGLAVDVIDREVAVRIATREEGSTGSLGMEWFSRERSARTGEAEMFEFTDASGRTFDAVGREGWVEIHTDAHILKFGFMAQHPDFERPIEPVVVDGGVNPLYAPAVGAIVAATLTE